MSFQNYLKINKNDNQININLCAVDNIFNNNIPVCFYNGKQFRFDFGFDNYININLFKKYLEDNHKDFIKNKKGFKYICIISKNDELKVFKLSCFNSFVNNKYHATSFFIYELINDYNLSQLILSGKFDLPEIDYDFNFLILNNQDWEIIWLFSLGFKRKEISNILKIKYETINQRLNRIKNKTKIPIHDIPVVIRKNNLILKRVPKRFQINKIIKLN